MFAKIKTVWNILLVLGVTIGTVISGNLCNKAQAADNYPLGRQPATIIDGQYPASYFPNTELLGADEMRITALGTGMPNQTRAAVSISYLVELGNGDTYPNKWYMKYAVGADIASHECFLPPKALAAYFGWDLTQATYVSTRIHTEPQAFGKVMSTIKPRLAVGYHSVQSPDNNAAIMDGVRKTYDGPLALARDLMVINVTKETIKTD